MFCSNLSQFSNIKISLFSFQAMVRMENQLMTMELVRIEHIGYYLSSMTMWIDLIYFILIEIRAYVKSVTARLRCIKKQKIKEI